MRRPAQPDRRERERERRGGGAGDTDAVCGLTFDQLARRAEDDFQRQALAVVIREELRDGRVRLDGERYVLVHEAFPPGVLEAVAELERFA